MKEKSGFLMIFSLAVRNLRHYWQRSLATIVVMGVGFMAYIVLDSFLSGMTSTSINNFQRYESGSGFIQEKAYWKEKQFLPLEDSIENPQPLEAQLEDLGISYTPQISALATLIFRQSSGFNFDGSTPLTVRGLDIDQDVFPLEGALVEGRWFEEGSSEIVVGSGLADDLGVQLGAQFTMSVRDRYGQQVVQPLSIVGIVDSDDPIVNNGSGFLSRSMLDLLLDMEGAVSEIVLGVAEKEEMLLETLPSILTGDLDFYTWEQRGADMLSLLQTKNIGGAVLLFLLFVIGFIGIWNTMNLSVYQRRGELAMCRALGFTNRQIRTLVVLESLLISFLGAILGLILAWPINTGLVNTGLDLSAVLKSGDVSFRLTGIIFGRWNIWPWLLTPFCAMLIALVASLSPAHKAMTSNLAELLTQEGAS